MLPRKHTQVID